MAALLIILSFLFPASGNREAAQLASRMEARYRGAKTLQASFLERYAENRTLLRDEAGTAYFRRPGKMRWQYERPENDLFLVDGKTAWFYVPADHTVTRAPAKRSEDLRTPLALLAGEMKISRVCSHVELADSDKPLREDHAMLRCKLRGQKQDASGGTEGSKGEGGNDSDQILFEVARDTGELARLIVRQPGGIEVEFRFENWRFDPPLPDAMFRFQPPAGVAIVTGELPDEKSRVN